ncbi:MAG: cupin domain-containing protein [Gammaproteobacteria bacterium]|nr:cupin domain-containing protein [Gammaproteobacteria bacterium]
MRINADLSLPAVVDGATLPWVASPAAGVERRMLERDGEEVARATSLVRYAPMSAFPAHLHAAGEEFLVLEGVFSDETGDFPSGWYVRNPPGSRHTPSSRPGAVILVKLRQMPPEERAPVRIDTRDPRRWQRIDDGLAVAPLYAAPWERVDLLRLAPGHAGAAENWPLGAEFYVVEGEARVGGRPASAGTWSRFPPASRVALASERGALIYRKSGHLGVGGPTAA